jgi:hypothetical protein
MRIKKNFYENKNKDRQSLDSSVRWNDVGVVGVWLAQIFHADLLRKQGRPMAAALDSGLSLNGGPTARRSNPRLPCLISLRGFLATISMKYSG